jgi:hypothetical protein
MSFTYREDTCFPFTRKEAGVSCISKGILDFNVPITGKYGMVLSYEKGI